MSVFAGFAKTLTGDLSGSSPRNATGKPKSLHEIFVAQQILPLTVKLQKEMRGRRNANVQETLKKAVDALTAFQTEEGMPSKAAAAEQSQTQASQKKPAAVAPAIVPESVADVEGDVSSTSDTASVVTDTTEPTDERQSPTTAAAAAKDPLARIGSTGTATSEFADNPTEDDPQTREPVHVAVTKTMQAFMEVLVHVAKTNRAAELALDGVNMLVSKQYFSGRAGGKDDLSGSGSGAIAVAKKNETELPPTSLLHRLIESISKTSESNVEVVQTAVVRTLRAIMTSPKCGVHEGTMLLALRSTFHVYLVTKSAACKLSSKTALLDMLRSVFFRMEAHDIMTRGQARKFAAGAAANEEALTTAAEAAVAGDGATASPSQIVAQVPFPSQYHTDSYVLIGSLCKMCSKELPVDTGTEPDRARLFNTQVPTDPLALNSKILSLELILSALDYCGDAFFEGEKFIYLVQNYLCVALLKNCVSNHTQVAFLSQKIFLVLVYKFKGHLKQEIEVFLSNIFLRVLDSQNSSFKQKALVLESLRSLCKDPVLLTQIFLNYDCDFDAMNLYKDIVHILTRIGGKVTTAPSASVSKKDAEEEYELSLAGMEVLVTILKAFLKALGLPGGESGDDDTAGERIRGILDIDVGLAARPLHESKESSSETGSTSDELSRSGRGSKSPSIAESEGPTSGTASSGAAEQIVDAFEMKRNAEQNFETGSVKFTLSLKSGLNFFIDNGFVERDARRIALFFIANKDKLDKTQMGEVLGKEPHACFVKGDGVDPDKGGLGFYVRILHHYADALHFTDVAFDDAIRLFLSGFRLPGEAQKIDRIMEKFAERFTYQNPDVFPSADTAFILAFSVIMLNTDLHNPSIKEDRRMTSDSFLRNNRGIGENGGDLPEDFLRGIFERIKSRPFSLKEDDAARERVGGGQKQMFEASVFFEGSAFFGTTSDERKREKFKKERDEMMSVTEQLIRRRPEKSSKASVETSKRLAETVVPADVVKPMFDVTWGPMIGILSQVLECMDDERSVAVCLNGFVYAIRIASHSNMSLARDTFVSSLAKFTFLGSIKEMKWKNVESIRTLLSIAVIDGEYLGESWAPVLQCISQMAKLRLTASGLDSDESFLVEKDSSKKAAGTNRIDLFADGGGLFGQASRGEIAREAEKTNGRAVLEAVQEVLLDKVFSATVNLSATSLAHFIQQLIAVSSSEITGNANGGITGVDASRNAKPGDKAAGPSIFSLQKLVEVADYNMNVRPRLVWAQVWEVMAAYFAKIACHENAMVSEFAIDSLKQLSYKFLEKPELPEFNFQRTFLNPFLIVMEDKGSREDIRELVLRCVDNIIRTKSHNLRSGWKVVFSILTRSASDPSEKIDYLGLAILQRLLDEHLHEFCKLSEKETLEHVEEEPSPQEGRNRNSNVDDFVGLCRASLAFVQKEEDGSSRPVGLSIRALCHTAIYADLLADQCVQPPVSGAQWTDPHATGYTYKGLSEKEALEMVLWRPLLEGLSEGARSSVRSSAGGVGCLVQRGSLLALRAIFLRHGDQFSTLQWAAILEQTLLPSIQAGALNDLSPVVGIISESPSVSSVDFLVESLPVPPPVDDVGFLKFEALNLSPNRSLGPAELLLEASFTDLRHGGDGNLRRAYVLAKMKSSSVRMKVHEQPFPDSWLATTAPLALGLLTDIASEIILLRGEEGREKLWPMIASQYKLWCLGRRPTGNLRDGGAQPWWPCEALVRIACREMHRFPLRIVEVLPTLPEAEARNWTVLVLQLFAEVLSENVVIEDSARRELVDSKQRAIGERKGKQSADSSFDDEDAMVDTPFGSGRIITKRTDDYEKAGVDVITAVIKLDFGATLYRPVTGAQQGSTSKKKQAKSSLEAPPRLEDGVPFEINVPTEYWGELVPELKVRCVAAHCAQQSLVDVLDRFVPFSGKSDVSTVLEALNKSRLAAETTVGDEDVSTAFQEALLNDWGDGGVAVVEQALDNAARLSHLHGSAVFFLTQEAGATKAVIHMLSILYRGERKGVDSDGWDREQFAEPHLLGVMNEVLGKFLASEEKDGHLIDPNVWRNASESGGKVALYCTSFAPVVVEILRIIRSIKPEQFAKHKQELFPAVCKLIRVQSEEIRQLVHEVLAAQVAPILGVQL